MKSNASLFLLTVSLVIFSTSGIFAQAVVKEITVTKGRVATQIPEDPDLKIINDRTLTVNGMLFPKIAYGNNQKSAMSCCNIGDTRDLYGVIDVKSFTEPVSPKGKLTFEETRVYSPPQNCWVIKSYNLTDVSMTGSTRSMSASGPGFSFVTSNEYQATYETLNEYITKLNIMDKFKFDIDKKIKTYVNNYHNYSQQLQNGNSGSVQLYYRLESKGKGNGRSWYEGQVNTTETCCPPEVRDPVTLKKVLTDWIDATVNALPNKGKPPTKIFPKDIKATAVEAAPSKIINVQPEIQPTPTPR